MTAPAITALPTAPSRTRPSTFSTEADAFLAAMQTFGTELNAAALFAQTEALAAEDATMIGWNFSTTTTMADPGSGIIRFNHGTLASVTAIAIDDYNSASQNFSPYVLTWDDGTGTIKGTLTVRQRSGAFAVFNLTGLTDNSGWTQLAVTYVAGNGPFVNAELAGISYVRAAEIPAISAGQAGLPVGVDSGETGLEVLETQRVKIGADVASATALTLGAGNAFDITGVTTITSIATKSVGCTVILQFDGILTLTHHATDLILPGGANITTAAGDIMVAYEYAAGKWRCVSYKIQASAPYSKDYVDSLTGLTISTFSPWVADNSNFASEGQTYGAANCGTYRKIGGLVFFDMVVAVTSIGTLTTSETTRVRGLPVPPVYQSFEGSGGVVFSASGLAITAGNTVSFTISAVSSEAMLTMYKWSATTGTTPLTIAELSGDGVLAISGCYPYR